MNSKSLFTPRAGLLALLLLAAPHCLQAQTLPPVPVPPENPITEAKRVLGKILFWDEQLSTDNTQACGTCHIPGKGGEDPRVMTPEALNPGPDGTYGTPDDIRGSIGVVRMAPDKTVKDDGVFFPNRQVTGRKAPSAIMAMYDPELFFDGRAGGTLIDPLTGQVVIPSGAALEVQALGPVLSDAEMACEGRTQQDVAEKIFRSRPLRLATNIPADMANAVAQYPSYPQLFEWAFGTPDVTPVRMAMAIATYERTLVSDQTPYDAYVQGNTAALTPNQQLGLQVFRGQAACTFCHFEPLFADGLFHDIGVRPVAEDLGRGAITGNSLDDGRFKTSHLRNVGLRAPYFHGGTAQTLNQAIAVYNRGGDFPSNPNLSPFIFPLGLNGQQRNALADFLQNGLTDPRVASETFPFDRPTLRSEMASDVTSIGPGSAGSAGLVPEAIMPMPPVIGSEFAGVSLANALGAAPAVVAYSPVPASPGTTFAGSPIYVDMSAAGSFFATVSLKGTPGVPGAGHGSVYFSIPDDPALAGARAYAQWFVVDAFGGGGLAASNGMQIDLILP